MAPCCGLGKILYFISMLTSVCLTIMSLVLPQWLKPNTYGYKDTYIGLLDCDPYISGNFKSQWFFIAICWALVADVIAFLNFSFFGVACNRPTQCYLAMRRSAVISCYVFSQFLAVIVMFPIEMNSKSGGVLGLSYYLLVAANATALIGVICGFITSQIMYNALKRDWNQRYTLCSCCLPF